MISTVVVIQSRCEMEERKDNLSYFPFLYLAYSQSLRGYHSDHQPQATEDNEVLVR